MKRLGFASSFAALLLAGCDRSSTTSSEAQRLAEERAALDRDRAALEAERIAAQEAANEQERARLEAERAALEFEKAKLAGDREATAAAEREARLAAERAQRLAAEKRAADEAAARKEAEMREREARADAAAADQARSAQSVDFFYDALDPHGDWIETDRYGYAFRPNASRDPHWRPYTDGGWVYSEYGWTWRSNEPFGWATYHYGRWARAPRLGWIWVPNTEWGPAWVSWRRSDDFIGWAPLPPDAWSSTGFTAAVDSYYDIGPGLYTFLPVGDFGEKTYVGRIVEPERNVTIINQTVNVTNVTYQKVQNNVLVVNRGPDITIVNQRSRRPVPRLNVERVSSGAGKPAQVVGNVLQMVAPALRPAPTKEKPRRVSGKVEGKDFERGWSEGARDSARFREVAREDARRAEAGTSRRPATPPAGVIPPAPRKPGIATPPPSTTPRTNRPDNRQMPPSTAPARPAATPRAITPPPPTSPKPLPTPTLPTPPSIAKPPTPAPPQAPERPSKRPRDPISPQIKPPTVPTPAAPDVPTVPEQPRRPGPGARQFPDATPTTPVNPLRPLATPVRHVNPQLLTPQLQPSKLQPSAPATPGTIDQPDPAKPPLKGFRQGRRDGAPSPRPQLP